MSKKQYLPAISSDGSISKYLREIHAFPMLSEQEEQELFMCWQKKCEIMAAQKLVSSHLRIVPKIAYGYQGYGLPIMDLISEGNLGLMHAVKKFNPEFGYRFSTYAVWWVKASIQDYILRSWSLVKISSSAAHKKLFFNFKKLKNKINNLKLLGESNADIHNIDENQYIADQLNLKKSDVDAMEQRLLGDKSLNYTVEDGEREMIDTIECTVANQESQVIEKNYQEYRKGIIKQAMETLNSREQEIIQARILTTEKPLTLDTLSKRFNVSKERVRQIEARALEKLKCYMQEHVADGIQ